MKLVIHQPEHIPWMGFFDKVSRGDVFVVLDTVQFEKNYYQNRNKIRSPSGEEFWVTVPVKYRFGEKIKDVKISTKEWESRFRRKYLESVERCFSNKESFKWWFPHFKAIIENSGSSISELNIRLIKFMLEVLGINTNIIIASEMNLPEVSGGTNVVEQICRELHADEYISGVGGMSYLDIPRLEPTRVVFNDPQFPHYSALERL